jgi:hypothetical protein
MYVCVYACMLACMYVCMCKYTGLAHIYLSVYIHVKLEFIRKTLRRKKDYLLPLPCCACVLVCSCACVLVCLCGYLMCADLQRLHVC